MGPGLSGLALAPGLSGLLFRSGLSGLLVGTGQSGLPVAPGLSGYLVGPGLSGMWELNLNGHPVGLELNAPVTPGNYTTSLFILLHLYLDYLTQNTDLIFNFHLE